MDQQAPTQADDTTPQAARARRGFAHKRIRLLLAAGFFLFYLFAIPRPWNEPGPTNTPRESVGLVLVDRAAEGHWFRQPLRYADTLPPDIARALTPRDAARVNGDIVPQDFAGTMLFYALLAALWMPLVAIATPLAAVGSAFLVAWLAEHLLATPARAGPRSAARMAGTVAFVLWLAHPSLIVAATPTVAGDTLSALSMLGAMVAFVRYWRGERFGDLMTASVCIGAAILFRYPAVLMALPPAVFLLVKKRPPARHLATVALVAGASLAVILVFNQLTYGSPTTTGYELTLRLQSETLNFADTTWFQPFALVNHLVLYAVVLPTIWLPQLIGLGLGLRAALRHEADRGLVLSLLAGTILLAAFHLPQSTNGSDSVVVNASLFRYLLAPLGLWTALGVRAVLERGLRIRPLAWIGVLLAVACLETAIIGPQGIMRQRAATAWITMLRDRVERLVPEDAIVMTRMADKGLFPVRDTLILSYLNDNTTPIPRGPEGPWRTLPDSDRLIDVLHTVHDAGIPVAWVDDFDGDELDRYRTVMEEAGFVFTPIDDSLIYSVYRVTRADAGTTG